LTEQYQLIRKESTLIWLYDEKWGEFTDNQLKICIYSL